MTREELKNKRLEIDKLFGTKDYKRRNFIFKYPILYLKNNKYYLSEIYIVVPKWKELSEEQSRFETYIDNLFDKLFKDKKIKVIEVLTDNDDTMQEFGNDFIPNIDKLRKKYNTTEILMDGFYGFHIGRSRDIVPPEYQVP